MGSYTQLVYHIVFATKHRKPSLGDDEQRKSLYRYVWGILKNKDCHLYRIGGTNDHVHILTSIHQTLSVSDLVRDLKSSCSAWMRDEGVGCDFAGWQEGYGAFSVTYQHRDALIEYIRNQEEHHRKESSLEEFRRLLREAGLAFDDPYVQ